MARASGPAADGLLSGTFLYPVSGITNRLFPRNGEAFLAYGRASSDPSLSLHGEQKLSYFIGSGKRGRTYLFEKRPRPIMRESDFVNFEIVPIGGANADPRDLGLAYAQFAEHGNQATGEHAMQLLQQAEQEERPATKDPDLHTELGFLDQMSGNLAAAEREYRLAIAMSPVDSAASGDLAVLLANSGKMPEAVSLWRNAFEQNPDVPAAGFDLAVGYCTLGDPGDAILTLQRVVAFSPDDEKARRLMQSIGLGTQSCKKK